MVVEAGKEPNIDYIAVTPHLLRTLGVPLLAGRDFTEIEGAGRSRVAIVNQRVRTLSLAESAATSSACGSASPAGPTASGSP